jgi:hypothetical protein
MPRPHHPRGISPRYTLDKRLGGPQRWSGRRGEGKILDPYRESNSDPSAIQPVASRYTDCAINNMAILENVYTLAELRRKHCKFESNGMCNSCSNTARAAITINRVLTQINIKQALQTLVVSMMHLSAKNDNILQVLISSNTFIWNNTFLHIHCLVGIYYFIQSIFLHPDKLDEQNTSWFNWRQIH